VPVINIGTRNRNLPQYIVVYLWLSVRWTAVVGMVRCTALPGSLHYMGKMLMLFGDVTNFVGLIVRKRSGGHG
jgi:hypothetical protein